MRKKFVKASILIIAAIGVLAVFYSMLRAGPPGSNKPLAIEGWHFTEGIPSTDENFTASGYLEDTTLDNWEFSKEAPYFNVGAGEELWAKHKLAEDIPHGAAIYFGEIAADFAEVYLNDRVVYKNDQFISDKKMDYVTNVIIPLGEDCEGKVITVRLKSFRGDMIGISGRVYLGNYKDIAKEIVGSHIFSIAVGAFFIILSVLLLFVGLHIRGEEKKSLLSLSLAVLSSGIWSVTGVEGENILLPDNPLLFLFLLIIASMITPPAFGYFYEKTFGGKYKSIIRRMWQVFAVFGILYILLDTIYVASGGRFLSYSVILFMDYIYFALILIEVVILIISTIKYIRDGSIDAKIFAAGAVILCISAVFYSLTFFAGKQETLIITVGIFLFIVDLVAILARRFLNAKTQLEAYSRELEANNWKLNNAREEIEKSKNEIAKWNKTLELRVEERTQQLKESNEELKRALDSLSQAQEHIIQTEKLAALGGLVAGVAHEINTPIGVSVTAASYLNEKTHELKGLYAQNKMKRSDLENYLSTCDELSESILSNLQRAASLVRSFKQVAADQSSEEVRRFNIEEYMQEILSNLRPKFKRTRHTINVKCPEEITIESYPGEISHVMTNLIVNSLMHAYDEGDAGSIDIEILKDGRNVIIKYSDDGKGIPEDIMDKIYDPFFTTKRSSGGTGLGLNIVFNIVHQRLRGTIKCESEPGRGTTFVITIPIERDELDE